MRKPDIAYCKKCGRLSPKSEEEWRYAIKKQNVCTCGSIHLNI